jgi:hypothetical protein
MSSPHSFHNFPADRQLKIAPKLVDQVLPRMRRDCLANLVDADPGDLAPLDALFGASMELVGDLAGELSTNHHIPASLA